MGVEGLWSIIESTHSAVSVQELRAKTLAVDFSGWLHQSKKAADLVNRQTIKPHLRNLFARVRLLLQHQIRLVFVLEGPAHRLKQSTLDKRHKQFNKYHSSQQGKYLSNGPIPKDNVACPSSSGIPSSQRGAHCPAETIECCKLLDCLGIPYITSSGEAEMTCAALNEQGIVDGCVTEDSDVFLYGARTVYRNFTVEAGKSKKGILCYEMSDIEGSDLRLTKEKLIAFALLAGCDYTSGVKDTGKEQAAKLLKDWPETGACQRLRDWRQSTPDQDSLETPKIQKKPTHCSKCDHPGSISRHRTGGCVVCCVSVDCTDKADPESSKCQCLWHQSQRNKKDKSLETRIKKRALDDPTFPNEEIIEIFSSPSTTDLSAITWTRPDYDRLQTFFHEHLNWSKDNLVDKLLPLITAWDMAAKARAADGSSQSQPDKILGTKTHEGVKLYEVQWKSIGGVTDQKILSCPLRVPLITREPQVQVEDALPGLVAKYKAQTPKRSAKKRARTDSVPTKQSHLESFFKVRKKLTFSKPETNIMGDQLNPHPVNHIEQPGHTSQMEQPDHSRQMEQPADTSQME